MKRDRQEHHNPKRTNIGIGPHSPKPVSQAPAMTTELKSRETEQKPSRDPDRHSQIDKVLRNQNGEKNPAGGREENFG